MLQKGETDRTLFTVNGQTYTGEMFKWFASSHPQAVKRQLNGFIAKSLLDYENRHVEKSIRNFVILCRSMLKMSGCGDHASESRFTGC